MRGKKKKQLTQEQKALVKEFEQWLRSEIEKDFIEQIRNYDPTYDILHGDGVSNKYNTLSL